MHQLSSHRRLRTPAPAALILTPSSTIHFHEHRHRLVHQLSRLSQHRPSAGSTSTSSTSTNTSTSASTSASAGSGEVREQHSELGGRSEPVGKVLRLGRSRGIGTRVWGSNVICGFP